MEVKAWKKEKNAFFFKFCLIPKIRVKYKLNDKMIYAAERVTQRSEGLLDIPENS